MFLNFGRARFSKLPSKDLVITGSGHTHLIHALRDLLFQEFSVDLPDDESTRENLEEVVTGFYQKHIFAFYEADSTVRPSVDLIVGCRCNDGALALVKSTETTVSHIRAYDSIGSGTPVFDYWASQLFGRELDIEPASHLLVFIIREVKLHMQGCGGDTDVMAIHRHPEMKHRHEVIDERTLLAGFPMSVAEIIADIVDFPKISQLSLELRINRLGKDLLKAREEIRAKILAVQRLRHSTIHETQSQPPLQE